MSKVRHYSGQTEDTLAWLEMHDPKILGSLSNPYTYHHHGGGDESTATQQRPTTTTPLLSHKPVPVADLQPLIKLKDRNFICVGPATVFGGHTACRLYSANGVPLDCLLDFQRVPAVLVLANSGSGNNGQQQQAPQLGGLRRTQILKITVECEVFDESGKTLLKFDEKSHNGPAKWLVNGQNQAYNLFSGDDGGGAVAFRLGQFVDAARMDGKYQARRVAELNADGQVVTHVMSLSRWSPRNSTTDTPSPSPGVSPSHINSKSTTPRKRHNTPTNADDMEPIAIKTRIPVIYFY